MKREIKTKAVKNPVDFGNQYFGITTPKTVAKEGVIYLYADFYELSETEAITFIQRDPEGNETFLLTLPKSSYYSVFLADERHGYPLCVDKWSERVLVREELKAIAELPKEEPVEEPEIKEEEISKEEEEVIQETSEISESIDENKEVDKGEVVQESQEEKPTEEETPAIQEGMQVNNTLEIMKEIHQQ